MSLNLPVDQDGSLLFRVRTCVVDYGISVAGPCCQGRDGTDCVLVCGVYRTCTPRGWPG